MTTFEAIRQTIAPELQQLDRRIADALASTNPLMNRVIQGYLQSKGKLIRPILVILTARLFGSVNDKTIASAAAVEMLHNASLIHDDVVDETKMRRGLPTVNALWDNHIAVLVGDFFVSNALQQAITTSDLRVIESISLLGKTLSLGEIEQIYNARYHTLDEKAYFEVISSKTASLFVSCVRMGAYSAGAVDDSRLEAMNRFARLLGQCFQIRDDIFDYFDDEKSVGKPTGNDLREGKVTLPLLYALTRQDLPEQGAMLSLSQKETLDDSDIHTLIGYARRAGGIDYAYATMQRLRDEAIAELAKVDTPDRTKVFADLIDFIIARSK